MALPLLAAAFLPVLSKLAENGLGLLAGAIQAKGKQVIEDKLGVKIPDKAEDITPELLHELKIREMEHEEFLINAQIAEKRLEVEADKAAQEEVTKRWQADMTSDNTLSKNARPLVLLVLTLNLLLLVWANALGAEFDPLVLELVKYLSAIAYGAYFLGRSTEKGIKMFNGRGKK